ITGERANEFQQSFSHAVIARLKSRQAGEPVEGLLVDALYDRAFLKTLLDAIARRRSFKGKPGEILGAPSRLFRGLRGPAETPLEPAVVKREQSNTSIVYGDRFILKVFRRLQDGINPDLEIGRFLTENTSFEHVPKVAGSLELRRGRDGQGTIAILHSWVRNEGDA